MIVHIDERLAQSLVDEEASKSRAVDEEVGRQVSPLRRMNRLDEPAFIQIDVLEFVAHVTHASRFRPIAQELRNEVRVEVPGMRHRPRMIHKEWRLPGVEERRLAEARVVDRSSLTAGFKEPVLRKRHSVDGRKYPERVVEMVLRAVFFLAPVNELYRRLEGTIHLLHPLVLGDFEKVEEHLL